MPEDDMLNWFIVGLQLWAQSEVEMSNPCILEDAYVAAERLVDTQHKPFTPSTKVGKKLDHRGKKDEQ